MDFLKFIFSISLFFLLAFCHNPQQKREKGPVYQKILKLEADLKLVEASNPVNAEEIVRQLIVISDSLKDYAALVSHYAKLSEIYQYQRRDDTKALEYITEVVKISSQHPGVSLSNPYLFIDAGNILYKYGLYDNAKVVYQGAARLALELKWVIPAMTAYHNTGLAWQYLNEPDSAENCFNHAYQLMPNHHNLMIIDNRLYLSKIALLKNRRDLVETYVRESEEVLEKFWKDSLENNNLKNGNLRYAYYNVNAKLDMLKGDLSVMDGNLEKGAFMYRIAIDAAKKSGQDELVYTLLYNYASVALKHHLPEFIALADTATRLAIQLKDMQYSSDMARLWTTHYQNLGDDVQKNFWNRKMAQADDSLKKIRSDEVTRKSLVQVNAAHLVLTINTLMLGQKNNTTTIFRQMITLTLTLFILICVIAVSGYFIYRYSHKLSAILLSSVKSRGNTLNKPKVHTASADTIDLLAKRLEALMQVQKKYLDPELSLKQLAFLLDTNPTYLSQVINQEFNKSYNDFINELRVQEACRMIEAGRYHTQTFETIGNEVGFISKSVFFTMFKKFTGMSPAAYRKTLQIRPN